MRITGLKRLLAGNRRDPEVVDHHGGTDVGLVRQTNQDYWAMEEARGLYLVCDGLGGHRGGELASRTTAWTIKEEVSGGRDVTAAIRAAHRAVAELEGEGGRRPRPASTVVALEIAGRRWTVYWAGDSRCWLFAGRSNRLVTDDHTVVGQLVSWGDITEEEARVHPERHKLTNAVGLGQENFFVGAKSGKLRKGQVFLLATDGLCHWEEPAELQRILKGNKARQGVEALIAKSLAMGGRDNVTCLVVHIG